MANSTPLKPGTILESQSGRYTVVRVLGNGGFGITYLVEGTVMVQNIPVKAQFALKEHFMASLCEREPVTQRVVYESSAQNTVSRAMRAFIQEATRLQSRGVEHTNIVRINEVFEANNTAYYVMEYLEGETLAEYIRAHGPMSPNTTFKLFRPIIDAVSKLHNANITHYDIKPGNIILARTESRKVRPVLIDFGLSRQYNDNGSDYTVTRSLGYSVGYSPIEQYAGIKQFTPQADVYALAASIYFCLTGEKPAGADHFNISELDSRLTGYVPASYIEALKRAMRYDREERTYDAGQFYMELYQTSQVEQTRVMRPDNDMTQYGRDDSTRYNATSATQIRPSAERYVPSSGNSRSWETERYETSRSQMSRRNDYDDYETYAPKRKSNGLWWLLLIVLLLALLGVGGYLVYTTYFQDTTPKKEPAVVQERPETPFEKAVKNYDSVSPLVEGLAMVGIVRDTVVANEDGSYVTLQKRYYGFINEQGKVVVPCKYPGANNFENGYALVNGGDYSVKYENGKAMLTYPPRYGYVDTSGREVVTAENFICNIEKGMVTISKDGKTQKFPLSEIYHYKEYLAKKAREEKIEKLDLIIKEVENIDVKPQYFKIRNISNADYDDSAIRDGVYELNALINDYNQFRDDYFADDYWVENKIEMIIEEKEKLLEQLNEARDQL